MKITLDVSDTLIAQALMGAHSRYWCERVVFSSPVDASGAVRGDSWEHTCAEWRRVVLAAAHATVTQRPDGGKLPEALPITARTIATGLGKLAGAYPAVFGRLVGGEADGEDGDTFLQCIVFGEVVYA